MKNTNSEAETIKKERRREGEDLTSVTEMADAVVDDDTWLERLAAYEMLSRTHSSWCVEVKIQGGGGGGDRRRRGESWRWSMREETGTVNDLG